RTIFASRKAYAPRPWAASGDAARLYKASGTSNTVENFSFIRFRLTRSDKPTRYTGSFPRLRHSVTPRVRRRQLQNGNNFLSRRGRRYRRSGPRGQRYPPDGAHYFHQRRAHGHRLVWRLFPVAKDEAAGTGEFR